MTYFAVCCERMTIVLHCTRSREMFVIINRNRNRFSECHEHLTLQVQVVQERRVSLNH